MTKYSDILGELYALDPSLKEREAELIPLIDLLLAERPDATPDTAFVETLRQRLRTHADYLVSSPSSFSFSRMIPKLTFAVVGALVGVVVTAPAVSYLQNKAPADPAATEMAAKSGETSELFGYQMKDVGSRAFGDLAVVDTGNTRPQSGGGGGAITMGMSAMPPVADNKIAASEEADRMMVPWNPVEYTYVYTGEELTPSMGDVTVFRRDTDSSAAAASLLQGFNLGLLDLSSFSNASIASFSLSQNIKNGYNINVNLIDGSISINQNWPFWDHPQDTCMDEACYQRYRLKPSDIPSDDVLLSIARDFLAEHGIPTDRYGTPVVDRTSMVMAGVPESDMYIPDSIPVRYPLLIEGKEVFDDGGRSVALEVSVHVRAKQVSDVWNLQNMSFEKATYGAVQDVQSITDFIAKLDKVMPDAYPAGTEVTRKTVELGTPTEGLLQVWRYEENKSEILYVPALFFPVTKKPDGEDYFWRTSIAVPLAAEILQQRMEENPGMPMPLMMPMEDGIEE